MNPDGEISFIKKIAYSDIQNSKIFEWKTQQLTNSLPDKITHHGSPLSNQFILAKGMVVKDRSNHLRNHKTSTQTDMPFMLGKNINRYSSHYEFYTTYKELEIIGGTKKLMKHTTTPRVLIRRTGNSVCATYSNTPELIESTLYIMTGKTEKDLKSTLALLNSKLMTYYAQQSFITNQQAFPQIVMSNLQQLPLAMLSSQQKDTLVKLVDRILAAKAENPQADTSPLEEEIDELVYALYGLTEYEKNIVKGK